MPTPPRPAPQKLRQQPGWMRRRRRRRQRSQRKLALHPWRSDDELLGLFAPSYAMSETTRRGQSAVEPLRRLAERRGARDERDASASALPDGQPRAR